MRLIDADELKFPSMKGSFNEIDLSRMDGYSKAIQIVRNAPTIDAAPVVRCGNCKWYDSAFYACSKYGICVDHDFFCADGERRE